MLGSGDQLYLEWVNEEGEIEKYKTIIASRDKNLYIEIPINEQTKKYGYFLIGTIFQATFYQDGKVYHFETELLGRLRENVPLLIMSYPGEEQLSVIQRRQHVRVDTSLDVAVHSVNQGFNPFTTITYDLSGGGCSVVLPQNDVIKEGIDVDLWIVLPMQSGRYQYAKIPSRVIRILEKDGRPIASFEFKDINSADRMHIIRYCFQRDLYLKKLMKKK
jgi:c-di-GMP-binding flagellar brake protein YcgR